MISVGRPVSLLIWLGPAAVRSWVLLEASGSFDAPLHHGNAPLAPQRLIVNLSPSVVDVRGRLSTILSEIQHLRTIDLAKCLLYFCELLDHSRNKRNCYMILKFSII